MRRSIVAGNWKMNGSLESSTELLKALVHGLGEGSSKAEVLVCPPFPYLPLAQKVLSGSAIGLGAQNASERNAGAFTGEVSVSMLKEFKTRYVIVGHSERRSLYGESNDLVAQKFAAVQAHGLCPILCVGETLEQRDAGKAELVVTDQLGAILNHCGVDALKQAVIAYEPVWAIGTGKTATPEQAQQMHGVLRAVVARRSAPIAGQLRILYGGSVNAKNAQELFAQPDIDGGLVGGASLKADEFISICKSVS
ncbi:MAG: triose-phosphate isomerase [Pseudohongiellaceae bacterium]|nr:triose-phosphate isomerase [Pseudohongiellaceae bacterium]